MTLAVVEVSVVSSSFTEMPGALQVEWDRGRHSGGCQDIEAGQPRQMQGQP